jgi:hypothetical protein
MKTQLAIWCSKLKQRLLFLVALRLSGVTPIRPMALAYYQERAGLPPPPPPPHPLLLPCSCSSSLALDSTSVHVSHQAAHREGVCQRMRLPTRSTPVPIPLSPPPPPQHHTRPPPALRPRAAHSCPPAHLAAQPQLPQSLPRPSPGPQLTQVRCHRRWREQGACVRVACLPPRLLSLDVRGGLSSSPRRVL